MLSKKNLHLAALMLLPLALSACGKKGDFRLDNVQMSTSTLDQRTYLNFEALVTIGQLKFPNTEVPILNPATMTSFGQLALLRQSDGTNKMIVSIDFETASRLNPALGYSLPNGREIPLSLGAQNATLIGIPVLERSRIYVGGDLRKEMYLGAALSIPAFDSILNQVSIPLNIFTAFPFSNSVTGVGGLFTSPAAGQNGLALFVKRTVQTTPVTAASVLTMGRTSGRGTSRNITTTAAPAADGALPTEIGEVDNYTLYRLNRMMSKRTTIKIK